MDDSSANKNIIDPPAAEESGWTDYLQDFSFSNCATFDSSPSMVSDAAWNGSNGFTRLNFDKLKRINHSNSSYDDDLEDTASSPVNSPKVSTLKQMEVNYKRIDDVPSGNFLEKQAISNNFWKHDREERSEKNIIDPKNIHLYVELRKRGLCLVPMATLINYIG